MQRTHMQVSEHACIKCSFVSGTVSDLEQHFAESHVEDLKMSENSEINENIMNLTKQTIALNKEVDTLKKGIKMKFQEIESLLGKGMTKILDDSTEKHANITTLIKSVNDRQLGFTGRCVKGISSFSLSNKF